MQQNLAIVLLLALMALWVFPQIPLVDAFGETDIERLENTFRSYEKSEDASFVFKAVKDVSDYYQSVIESLKNDFKAELKAEMRQEMLKIKKIVAEHFENEKTKAMTTRSSIDCSQVDHCLVSNFTKLEMKSNAQEIRIMENQMNIDKIVEIDLDQLQGELDELKMKITNIEGIPRFIAEIHSAPANVLPAGNVEDYNELLDESSDFDPVSGYFTVPNDDSIFVFIVDADKPDNLKENEVHIAVKLNGNVVQNFWNNDESNGEHIAGLVGLRLKKGDQVNVQNFYSDSIMAKPGFPFTFMGIQL